MAEFSTRSPKVLVVEDDPHVLSFMESSLTLSGFAVLSAKTYAEAMKRCEETGLEKLWAVISDYRLLDQSGLDLLKYILSRDTTLATLLITGQGEKALVQESLSLGVFEYLEKPVTHQELRRIIKDAVQHTQQMRQSVRDRQGLKDLGELDQRMSGIVPDDLKDRLQVFYQPLHEVGGDFLITHTYSKTEWVILVGDVSGHDIKSGYVSTYFQGMFRGCVENGSRVQEALQLFNRVLRDRHAGQRNETDRISLSLSAFYINFDSDRICHWNFGSAPCYFVSKSGHIRECPYGLPPLGWLDKIDLSATHIPVEANDCLYAFTDGLIEFAAELRVSFFSLFFRLMESQNVIYDLPNEPKDDILAVKYSLNPKAPLSTQFHPLVSEHYAGTEVEQIDHLQSNWRRSLMFALDDRLGDRLYDLLICIREGMLNALIHGCEKAPDKFAHLQISLSDDKNVLRVVIDDPGRGHEFDLKNRLEQISTETGKHLGLGIIQHLSDDFSIENKGTSLVFDFEITPVHA
jgi:sigma-B regulation protein RsbU (phosphoserine phosphatase)